MFISFLSPGSFQPFKTYFVFLFAVTCHLAGCADGTKTVGDVAHSWTPGWRAVCNICSDCFFPLKRRKRCAKTQITRREKVFSDFPSFFLVTCPSSSLRLWTYCHFNIPRLVNEQCTSCFPFLSPLCVLVKLERELSSFVLVLFPFHRLSDPTSTFWLKEKAPLCQTMRFSSCVKQMFSYF